RVVEVLARLKLECGHPLADLDEAHAERHGDRWQRYLAFSDSVEEFAAGKLPAQRRGGDRVLPGDGALSFHRDEPGLFALHHATRFLTFHPCSGRASPERGAPSPKPSKSSANGGRCSSFAMSF